MRTHIKIDNIAMSRGYSESTKTTPMMYHITPFDCFCGPKRREDVFSSEQKRGRAMRAILTYLFALAHEEAEYPFIGALERGIIESEDIGRNYDEHSARKHNHNTFR